MTCASLACPLQLAAVSAEHRQAQRELAAYKVRGCQRRMQHWLHLTFSACMN